MQDIVIRNNGQDDSVFVDTRDIKIEELQFNGEGVLSTCTLKFDFDKLVHKHEHNAASKIWTGKFICVANLEFGQTPQMARSVLPNSLKTEIVVTANYREWIYSW